MVILKNDYKACGFQPHADEEKIMKNIFVQMKLMFKRKSFIITFAGMMMTSISVFLYNSITYFNRDFTAVKAAKYLYMGSDLMGDTVVVFMFIIPIISVLPFADTFFEERKNKTTEFCLSITSNNTYYFSKLFTVFFSGFIVNFIPFLTNMLLNFIAFPLDSSVDATNMSYVDSHLFADVMETGLFQELFARNMYLYNLLYLLILSVCGGLFAVIVYQFSFFYSESRILLNFSFLAIYCFLYMILEVFKLPEFGLVNYMFAASFYAGQSIRGFIITLALLVSAAVIPIPFAKKRLNDCYD